MKKVLLTLMLCFVTTAFSQENRSSSELTVRVDPNKPTVYISYVCQDEKKIYLRMNNNTVWHIYIEANKSYFPTKKPIKLQTGAKVYAIPSDEEVPLFYYVEKDPLESIRKIKVPSLKYPYKNGGGWIASQDSILFSVPIEHLREGLQIYVEFSYEWELERQVIGSEPRHRVYFSGGDIGSPNTGIEPMPCKK